MTVALIPEALRHFERSPKKSATLTERRYTKSFRDNQWPRQPWFVETGDVHGNGNLVVFTDGSISDLTIAK
jgi:hypothetical protein